MKITLSGYELADAISAYIELQFGKQVEVDVDDLQEVTAHITFKPMTTEEESETTVTKKKRTRVTKKKDTEPEIEDEDEWGGENIPINTNYADLPKLTQDERAYYMEILELLNNNVLNKNKEKIQQLVENAVPNVKTVIEANKFYQNWVKVCENPAPILKTFEDSISKNKEQQTEEVQEVEEPVNTTTPSLFTKVDNVQKSSSIFASSNEIKKVF